WNGLCPHRLYAGAGNGAGAGEWREHGMNEENAEDTTTLTTNLVIRTAMGDYYAQAMSIYEENVYVNVVRAEMSHGSHGWPMEVTFNCPHIIERIQKTIRVWKG
ncbi:MAG: hypothetical protein ACE5FI_19010, partial [Anaerolineales bacterium]